MRKTIIIKAILFIIGLSLLFPLKTIYLLHNDKYKELSTAKIVYHSIEKSKKKRRNVKTLIIGDSVAQQLFSNYTYNDSTYSLACNQSITLAGQYVLLKNFLSANQHVEKIILIYTPFAFEKNLNQQYTFQYFLKPFYKDENKDLFSSTVKNQIKKVPFYFASQFGPVLTSNWSPEWYGSVDSSENYFMSQVNAEYLTKIISLCHDDSIKFLILPTPTKISSQHIVKDYQKALAYTNYNFGDYFSKIIYIQDSLFLDDVHLKYPQNYREGYNTLISKL